MIRYMSDSKTGGKNLEWEVVLKGEISAAIVSGYAKSMVGAINSDIEMINNIRKKGHEKSMQFVGKCDASSIIMRAVGSYIVISFTIMLSMVSEKNTEDLNEMGFINRKI